MLNGNVTQQVECQIEALVVAGSIPAVTTNTKHLNKFYEKINISN